MVEFFWAICTTPPIASAGTRPCLRVSNKRSLSPDVRCHLNWMQPRRLSIRSIFNFKAVKTSKWFVKHSSIGSILQQHRWCKHFELPTVIGFLRYFWFQYNTEPVRIRLEKRLLKATERCPHYFLSSSYQNNSDLTHKSRGRNKSLRVPFFVYLRKILSPYARLKIVGASYADVYVKVASWMFWGRTFSGGQKLQFSCTLKNRLVSVSIPFVSGLKSFWKPGSIAFWWVKSAYLSILAGFLPILCRWISITGFSAPDHCDPIF